MHFPRVENNQNINVERAHQLLIVKREFNNPVQKIIAVNQTSFLI